MFKCSLVSPEFSNLFLQLTTVAGQQGPLSNGCKHQTFEETEIYQSKLSGYDYCSLPEGRSEEGEHTNSVQENLLTPQEHLKASAGPDDEIIQLRLGLPPHPQAQGQLTH